MSEARRLGGDWFEYVDPGTGKKYYANTTTQETRWNWPDEIPSTAEAKFEPSPMAHPTTVIEEKKMDTSDPDQWEYEKEVELGNERAGVFATDRASAVAMLRNHAIVLDQYVDSTGTLMIGELKYRVGTGSPTNPNSDTLCFKDADHQEGKMATWRRDVRVDMSEWRKGKIKEIKMAAFFGIMCTVVGLVSYLDGQGDNMMVFVGVGVFVVIASIYAWLGYLPNKQQQFDAMLASQPNIIGVPIVSRREKPKDKTFSGAMVTIAGRLMLGG